MEQLADQMNVFLTDERFNRIHPGQKKILISPIFRHFADDFILGYGSAQEDGQFSPKELAVLSFIKIYLQEPKAKQWIEARGYKVKYLRDDASLNEAEKTK